MHTIKLLWLFLSVFLLPYSPILASPEPLTEKIVWEDLKIQKLMPGFMVFPAIEPFLPDNFVALKSPDIYEELYWGEKSVLESFFKDPTDLQSAIIKIGLSANVGEEKGGSFTGEETLEEDLASQGLENIKIKKRKWASHPVMSFDASLKESSVHMAWIGLNYEGLALYAALICPSNSPSQEDLKIWTDFLDKTKALDMHSFLKSHGQDLRIGMTLVNLYGSQLNVFAEKRIKDNKIQVVIEPTDDQISCKCKSASEKLMEASWHLNEPILKIEAVVQKTGEANIISSQVISILVKEVPEFSYNQTKLQMNTCARQEYGNISIYNFCEEDVIEPVGQK